MTSRSNNKSAKSHHGKERLNSLSSKTSQNQVRRMAYSPQQISNLVSPQIKMNENSMANQRINQNENFNHQKFIQESNEINRGPEHQFVSVNQVLGQNEINFECQEQINDSYNMLGENQARNESSEISMIHIKQQNETRDFGQSLDSFQIADDLLNQNSKNNHFKKSHLEVLQAGKRHIPSPLRNRNEQSTFFKDETDDSGFDMGSTPSRPSIPNVINDINLYQPAKMNMPKSRLMVTDSTADNFFRSPNNDPKSEDEFADSDDDLQRMEEENLDDIMFLEQKDDCQQDPEYQEFLERETTKHQNLTQVKEEPKVLSLKNIKFKKTTNDQDKIKKIKLHNTSGEYFKNFKTISLPKQRHHDQFQSPGAQNFVDSAAKSGSSHQASSSKNKTKLKLNSRYSNAGATQGAALMKIESLYQVPANLNQSVEGNDERKEIQMDHPRLKIFRFKHHKTSLEGEQERLSAGKYGSQEKVSADRKSSLEVYGDDASRGRYRGASRKAASRYDPKTDESNSFERMSNINLDNELNQMFFDSKTDNTKNHQANNTQPLRFAKSKSPNDHPYMSQNETSTFSIQQRQARIKESKSNDKVNRIEQIDEDVDEILSNSQIQRQHSSKFQIKRFSAALVQNPIVAPATQRLAQFDQGTKDAKSNLQLYKSKSPPKAKNSGRKQPQSQLTIDRDQDINQTKVMNESKKINFRKVDTDVSPLKQKKGPSQHMIAQKIKLKHDKIQQTKIKHDNDKQLEQPISKNKVLSTQESDKKPEPSMQALLKPSTVKQTQGKGSQGSSLGSQGQTHVSSDIQKQLNKIQEEISMIHSNIPNKSSLQKKKSRDQLSSNKKQPPVTEKRKVPKFQSNLSLSKKGSEDEKHQTGKTQVINQTKQLRNDFLKKGQISSQKNILQQKQQSLQRQHISSHKQLAVGSGLIDVSRHPNTTQMAFQANMTGSITTQTLSGGPTVGTERQTNTNTNTNSTGSGVVKSKNSDTNKKAQKINIVTRSKSPTGMASCLLQTTHAQTTKASAVDIKTNQVFAKKASMPNQKTSNKSQCDKNVQNLKRYLSGSGSSSALGPHNMQLQQFHQPGMNTLQRPMMYTKPQKPNSGSVSSLSNQEQKPFKQHLQVNYQTQMQPKTSARQTYPLAVDQDKYRSQKSGRKDQESVSQDQKGCEDTQRSDSRKMRTNIPRHTPPMSQAQQQREPAAQGKSKEKSSLSSILCSTKEAIQKQKQSSKIENTKKIILKNQQQMLNKQQQFLQKQIQDQPFGHQSQQNQQSHQLPASGSNNGVIQLQMRHKNDQDNN